MDSVNCTFIYVSLIHNLLKTEVAKLPTFCWPIGNTHNFKTHVKMHLSSVSILLLKHPISNVHPDVHTLIDLKTFLVYAIHSWIRYVI